MQTVNLFKKEYKGSGDYILEWKNGQLLLLGCDGESQQRVCDLRESYDLFVSYLNFL